MANITDELKKDSQKFEKQLEKLDRKTFESLVEDQVVAEQYAREYIEDNEPENLSDEYVKILTSEIQTIAKMRLRERFYD